jgi:hypothetical protein
MQENEDEQNHDNFRLAQYKMMLYRNSPPECLERAKILGKTVEELMIFQLNKIVDTTEWLNSLFPSFEDLSVCISIATACKTVPGFPLIYVNTAFENTCGYLLAEIIGKNCRFLQVR